jgi:hypothetical protein
MTNKNIYLEVIFDHIIGKNQAPEICELCNSFGFYEFSGFPAKIVELIACQRNDKDG